MIQTKDILGMEVPVYEGTHNESFVKIVAPGCDLGFRKPIKSKEFIDISEDLAMKLIRCIPQRDELLCGDIFLSGKYPSPDIEMRIKLNAFHCVARVTPYTKEEIYNQVISKNEDPSGGKAITCGEIQLVMDMGINLSPIVIYSPIRLNCETISIIFTGNFFQMPNAYARIFRERGRAYKDVLAPLVNAMDNMYLRALTSWIAIQTMLLNPVIAIRFKRTTVPDDSTKVIKKGKKQPKRYVKKIIIDDLSDLEFGETKGKHIKEPFWWVSGHWREYKSGKKIFIEGYWKGPFREYGHVDEPREREIVFDTGIDAFKKN